MPTETTKQAQNLVPGDLFRLNGVEYVVNKDGVTPSRVGKVIIHTDKQLFRADVDQEFVVIGEG